MTTAVVISAQTAPCTMELPEDLLRMIFKEWLSGLKDFANLDIAVCSARNQRLLFVILSKYSFSAMHGDITSVRDWKGYLQWIKKRQIALDWCTLNNRDLTKATVKALQEVFSVSQMKVLNLQGCTIETVKCLSGICAKCPAIEELNLNNVDCRKNTKMNDTSLRAIPTRCPSLTRLSLDNADMSDAGLQYLSKGCTHLRSLSIRENRRITDAGLRFIGEGCPALPCWK